MRRLLIVGVLGVMVVSLAACGDSGSDAETAALQLKADKYEIEQIEKVFHEAMTTKDIDLMVSLWAPNATLTVGPEATAAGVDEIRQFWLEQSVAFAPETTWITDHPAYKMEITVNGDGGTLHFECHFVNYKTGEIEAITGTDQDVARIDGRWLITNMVGASTELTL
jgi:ketosteroid isomerase-like protein